MTWWAWTLVYLGLLVLAGYVVFRWLRLVWRKGMAVLDEVGRFPSEPEG